MLDTGHKLGAAKNVLDGEAATLHFVEYVIIRGLPGGVLGSATLGVTWTVPCCHGRLSFSSSARCGASQTLVTTARSVTSA